MGIWPISIYPITVNDWTMRGSGNARNVNLFHGHLLCRFQPGQTAFSHEIGKVYLFWAFYIGKVRKKRKRLEQGKTETASFLG